MPLDDSASALSKLIDDATQTVTGRISGNVGGKVNVRLANGQRINGKNYLDAIAFSGCDAPGDVTCFKTDRGWLAVGKGRQDNLRTLRQYRRSEPDKKPDETKFAALFYSDHPEFKGVWFFDGEKRTRLNIEPQRPVVAWKNQLDAMSYSSLGFKFTQSQWDSASTIQTANVFNFSLSNTAQAVFVAYVDIHTPTIIVPCITGTVTAVNSGVASRNLIYQVGASRYREVDGEWILSDLRFINAQWTINLGIDGETARTVTLNENREGAAFNDTDDSVIQYEYARPGRYVFFVGILHDFTDRPVSVSAVDLDCFFDFYPAFLMHDKNKIQIGSGGLSEFKLFTPSGLASPAVTTAPATISVTSSSLRTEFASYLLKDDPLPEKWRIFSFGNQSNDQYKNFWVARHYQSDRFSRYKHELRAFVNGQPFYTIGNVPLTTLNIKDDLVVDSEITFFFKWDWIVSGGEIPFLIGSKTKKIKTKPWATEAMLELLPWQVTQESPGKGRILILSFGVTP